MVVFGSQLALGNPHEMGMMIAFPFRVDVDDKDDEQNRG
jgi:hypothetical protein